MSRDRLGVLLDRLVALADPAFSPPEFDANVAVEVLGASAGLLTPHRRLLELRNGLYAHDHALHVFGACESPAWHSLRLWNAPTTWRDAYGPIAGLDELVFFAEDAFGDQFGYEAVGGRVVIFEAEVGRIVPVAGSFADWLEEMLDRPGASLPIDVLANERAQSRFHKPGTHLFAWPPLCTAESSRGVSLGHVDAVEAMRFRGELARQIRHLPTGARVEVDLTAFAPGPRR